MWRPWYTYCVPSYYFFLLFSPIEFSFCLQTPILPLSPTVSEISVGLRKRPRHRRSLVREIQSVACKYNTGIVQRPIKLLDFGEGNKTMWHTSYSSVQQMDGLLTGLSMSIISRGRRRTFYTGVELSWAAQLAVATRLQYSAMATVISVSTHESSRIRVFSSGDRYYYRVVGSKKSQ